MRARLILYVIALVVLPTAVLSMLAAVAVRDREQNIQKRLETAAERTVRNVSRTLMTSLEAAHAGVLRAQADPLSQDGTLALVAAAENARRESPLIDQPYVIRLPDSFIYPPVGDMSVSNAVWTDQDLLATLHVLQNVEGTPEKAVREYEKILAIPGISSPAQVEATLGAGRCYRELGEFKLAAGAFRQVAGYAGGQGDGPWQADAGLKPLRDTSGAIYTLAALKELAGVYRLAEKQDAPEARGRWKRLAIESEVEFLERFVMLYGIMTAVQREECREWGGERGTWDVGHETVQVGQLVPKLPPAGNMPSYERKAIERVQQLHVLLREQERNQQFVSAEGGAVMDAVAREVGNNGIRSRMTWLVIRGTPFTLGLKGGGNDVVGGFKVNKAGVEKFLCNLAEQMAAEQGIVVTIEHASIDQGAADPEGSSVIKEEAEDTQHSNVVAITGPPLHAGSVQRSLIDASSAASKDGLLASAALEWPFNDMALNAYAVDPGVLKRNTVLMLILKEWGILMLALGVLAGAWVVFRLATAETRRLKERGDYVAGISHDLRTPLTSMRMLAESLYLDRVKDPARQKQFLETIIGESRRLGYMVERVLFFVRFGENALAYQLHKTDIGEVVRQTVESFTGGLAAETTNPGDLMNLFIEPDLPPAMADPAAIGQVILNLMDNALKYSKRAMASPSVVETRTNGLQEGPSRSGRIEVSVRRGRDGIDISVKDEGPGIDKRELKKIFRKFYRVRGVGRDTVPGIGLGLALCQHIARGHGGRIDVESEPGKGSTFTVHLPEASA